MKILVVVLAALVPASQESDLSKKLTETYGVAADWLVQQQDPSGAWKQGNQVASPAYTGLIVTAFGNAPENVKKSTRPAVDKAVEYLLSKVNLDGSIGEGPSGAFLKTYGTAIGLMAFSSVERNRKIEEAIRGAQAYLKNNQLKEGPERGGSGYGDDVTGGDGKPRKTIANMSTVGFAAEGLKMSGLPQDDEFWKLVVEFVRKCQNSSEVNTDPQFAAALKAKGLSVGDDGGLYYGPYADSTLQKAGTKKIADREVIQSYGSMTYDGLKTYLYAGLKKDAPEVKAAIDWVRKNYSVEAHPGFSFDAAKRDHLRGLYHYYLVMARALDAYGENPLETFDGRRREWPKDLAEQLLKTVRESKMWKNENPGWYEDDPVLVTSYVLVTCDILLKYVK